MKEKISALQTACQKNIEKAATLQELDNIRVQVLGKKGELTELSKKNGGFVARGKTSDGTATE